MKPKEIINKINTAVSIKDVFPDLKSGWKSVYNSFASVIHPDKCSLDGAEEAMGKLNGFKTELENGKIFSDESGEITYFPFKVVMSGNKDLLDISLKNYNILKNLKTKAAIKFNNLLPEKMFFDGEKLIIEFDNRYIPLFTVNTLPQEHVNWVYRRMITFSSWLAKEGFVHSGINPDSVFIDPLNHHINVITFYHMAEKDTKIKTISGKWSRFYQEDVFRNKLAKSLTDVELCKKTAIWLLGDKTGRGSILRWKKYPKLVEQFLNFEPVPYNALISFTKVMSEDFDTTKFIKLNI